MKMMWGNPFKHLSKDTESDIEFLSSVSIFDALSRRQKNKLNSFIHVRNYDVDEIVFRQGDPGVGLYIIREGEVSVYTENAKDMTKTCLATLTKGDFFGEIALLNEAPRSATIVTSKTTVLLGLFRTDLLGLMDTDPKLGLRIVYRLAQIVAERYIISSDTSTEALQ